MNRLFLVLAATFALPAIADVTVPMHQLNDRGVGEAIGEVKVSESKYGLVFSPNLNGLDPGLHGFHVHENPDCGAREKDGKPTPGLAAGGHYDPHGTKRHGPPWGEGHLGDLPALYVDQNGKASHPVLAPRLKLSDLSGRALMVHRGGDNYADHPEPLGGGGPRVACGVIK